MSEEIKSEKLKWFTESGFKEPKQQNDSKESGYELILYDSPYSGFQMFNSETS